MDLRKRLGDLVNRGTKWKKLTRRDLSNFDSLATEAVLTAMEQGATGRLSARGHVTIRHPHNGLTMSVTHNTSEPRAAKNIRADLRRLFPDLKQTNDTKTNDSKDTHMNSQQPAFSSAPQLAPPVATPAALANLSPDQSLLPCPAKGCDKEFATEGARHAHIRDQHAVCTWEGCDYGPDGGAFVGANGRAVSGHVNVYHRGYKPWEHRDQSPEALKASAKKAVATRQKKAAAKSAPKKVEAKSETAPSAMKSEKSSNTLESVRDITSGEHRGLPQGEVKHRPMSAAAKLQAIREILGEDPRIAKLQAEIEDLKAHLDLVREAVTILGPTGKKK